FLKLHACCIQTHICCGVHSTRTGSHVSNSDIILKSARVKLPTWGAWDILKGTWLEWSRCFEEGIHVSTRGTIHDQRNVSQGGLDQRDCSSDWTRSQNHSAGCQRA